MEMIQFLVLNCKADVNVRAAMGETPLHVCVKNCNLFTIEFLIENHADLNARDNYNRSVLHWSAYTGKVIMLYYFQKYHGLNDLNELDQFEQNVLLIACSLGFQELIRYLLDHGQINLNVQDCNGNTCLHLTVLQCLPRISWLITQQSNGQCIRLITLLNKQNQTPFDLIRNENAGNFKLIRNWLRFEVKTNDYILSEKRIVTVKKNKKTKI
jgi:ankyrin repeat protein